MIRLEHVTKTFRTKDGDVHAVKDVSLHIREGQIYGIIGFSGAGKSTLVRLHGTCWSGRRKERSSSTARTCWRSMRPACGRPGRRCR